MKFHKEKNWVERIIPNMPIFDFFFLKKKKSSLNNLKLKWVLL